MALKILLLGAAAVLVWMMTRPRNKGEQKKEPETRMTQCARCGVYHPANETCDCGN